MYVKVTKLTCTTELQVLVMHNIEGTTWVC